MRPLCHRRSRELCLQAVQWYPGRSATTGTFICRSAAIASLIHEHFHLARCSQARSMGPPVLFTALTPALQSTGSVTAAAELRYEGVQPGRERCELVVSGAVSRPRPFTGALAAGTGTFMGAIAASGLPSPGPLSSWGTFASLLGPINGTTRVFTALTCASAQVAGSVTAAAGNFATGVFSGAVNAAKSGRLGCSVGIWLRSQVRAGHKHWHFSGAAGSI
jgi:hypothetical protein